MQHHHLTVTDSTNEHAKRFWHLQDLKTPVLFSANTQTQGKGTQGRVWSSPEGCGLYISLLLPATQSPHDGTYPWTQAVGNITLEWLKQQFFPPSSKTPCLIYLKPVNDLMVEQRKLGGILVEAVYQGNIPQVWIIGVGINLMPPVSIPGDYPERAISLTEILTDPHPPLIPRLLALSLGETLCQKLSGSAIA